MAKSNNGCYGWPCRSGFLCDWCNWSPKVEAKATAEDLQQQNDHLRRFIRDLEARLEDEEKRRKRENNSNPSKYDNAIEIIEKERQIERLKEQLEHAAATNAQLAESMDRLKQTSFEYQTEANKYRHKMEDLEAQNLALQRNLDSSKAQMKSLKEEIKLKREEMMAAYSEKARAKEEALRSQAALTTAQLELQIKQEQMALMLQKLDPLIQAKNEVDIARTGAQRTIALADAMIEEVARDVDQANKSKMEAKKIKRQTEAENQIVKLQMRDLQTQLQRERAKLGFLRLHGSRTNND